MKRILFAMIVLFATPALAQSAQQCICTAGCRISADPYPNTSEQPSMCKVYKGGVQIASSAPVDAATIPTSNASVCKPPDVAYVPGPAGSVACRVLIPAQTGQVTLTMRLSFLSGDTGDSPPLTFTSVATLIPPPPVNLRVVSHRGAWIDG